MRFHIPGKENDTADMLSRAHASKGAWTKMVNRAAEEDATFMEV